VLKSAGQGHRWRVRVRFGPARAGGTLTNAALGLK
jgi:hypothetical protein